MRLLPPKKDEMACFAFLRYILDFLFSLDGFEGGTCTTFLGDLSPDPMARGPLSRFLSEDKFLGVPLEPLEPLDPLEFFWLELLELELLELRFLLEGVDDPAFVGATVASDSKAASSLDLTLSNLIWGLRKKVNKWSDNVWLWVLREKMQW